MTFDQIAALVNTNSPYLIFAALFIWLFTKDRDDSRSRELWFRDAVEKQRVTQEATNEQLRLQTQAMSQMLTILSRIESNQRGDWKKGA